MWGLLTRPLGLRGRVQGAALEGSHEGLEVSICNGCAVLAACAYVDVTMSHTLAVCVGKFVRTTLLGHRLVRCQLDDSSVLQT